MRQPVTVTVDGSGVLDNFWDVPKKQTFVRVQEKVVLPEPVLKADGARLEALEVVSGGLTRAV